ncbi:MAG: hypothetical protein ABIN00_08195 [candidate division WOR-3 bacterium]
MSKYQPFKELEQTIARELRLLGFDAKRNWAEQFEEKSGRDITANKPENALYFCIQCKYGLKPNLKEAWIEANSSKEREEIPLGICRFKEDKNTLVVLSWRDFKKLIEKGGSLKNKQ